jgi:hypothetical protein
MTPTLQQKPESVGGSPRDVREDVNVASLYSEWGHLRTAPYRETWRMNGAPGPARDWEAYWLAQAADLIESACAAFAFAAAERNKWRRIEASPETWDAIDGGRGK